MDLVIHPGTEFTISEKILPDAKIACLTRNSKNIFFISDGEKFILQENNELIEKREGKYYLFPTDTQVIVCSEDVDQEHLRIAVYRFENYTNPQKVKVKISKHIALKSFPYEIQFVDITSQKMLINIIRDNNVTGKKESVIAVYRIHDGFKVRYDQNIITTPKYFGEVCVDSESSGILTRQPIQGYKFIPYDDAIALFNNIRIYIEEDSSGNEVLKYKNLSDQNTHFVKIIKGRVGCFEKMDWEGECISYLEKMEDEKTYLKFIFDETKNYLSFLFDKNILYKYTLYSTIYCVTEDKIISVFI